MSRIVLPALLIAASALTMLSTGMRGVDAGLGPLDTALFWGAFLVFACASALLAKAVTAHRAQRADERR